MTSVFLLNVPFESDYKDTLYFANKTTQQEYMRSRQKHIFNNFTYQRKDNIIRIPAHIDTLYDCNYVMYKNEESSRVMYAFIVDMQYINDERTDIAIQTDVIQTWMFDYTVQPSFIEREHVDDDTIGVHTIPEGLETGPFVCNYTTEKKSLKYRGIMVGATIELGEYLHHDAWLEGKIPNTTGVIYYGVYSGVKYFYFATSELLNEALDVCAKNGQIDAIVSIFMVPSAYFEVNASSGASIPTLVGENDKYESMAVEKEWNEFLGTNESDVAPSKPIDVNGYTPKNNKLFTHPYCYLMADNNAGSAVVYRYEMFNGPVDFKIYSTVTPGMSIRMVPKNYNGVAENNSEGLNLGKFPICNWSSDVYTNWLTQNGVNIALNTASGVGQMISGAVVAYGTGGAATAIGAAQFMAGVSTVANQMAQVNQMSMTPPAISGNLNSGDVTFSAGKLTFTLYQMSISKEYAKIIDEFFSMYGYKVTSVKKPNVNHRKSYWYTKTIDVNVDGAIPNKDLQEIKNCYNKGITFWRSNVSVGNYAVDNSIV